MRVGAGLGSAACGLTAFDFRSAYRSCRPMDNSPGNGMSGSLCMAGSEELIYVTGRMHEKSPRIQLQRAWHSISDNDLWRSGASNFEAQFINLPKVSLILSHKRLRLIVGTGEIPPFEKARLTRHSTRLHKGQTRTSLVETREGTVQFGAPVPWWLNHVRHVGTVKQGRACETTPSCLPPSRPRRWG